MGSLRPIFFDTETTGTRPDSDRIIEIAAYDPVRNQSFERLINPGIAIPPDSTLIHQITDDMVKNAKSFGEVAEEFVQFCSDDVVLIGHNAQGFDVPFLQNEFKRAAGTLPSHWLFLDSLRWARKYRKDLPRHSLQFLRQIYAIPANQAHRALNDVMVLYQVFQELIDDLTMEQVLELLNSGNGIEVKKDVLYAKPEVYVKEEALTLFN